MPPDECFPHTQSVLGLYGALPASSGDGTLHCILWDAWCPEPVGPVTGGGVQRSADGQQGVSSRTLPLWLNRVFSAVLVGAVCRFVCDLMPRGLRVFP